MSSIVVHLADSAVVARVYSGGAGQTRARSFGWVVFDSATEVTVGDGVAGIPAPAWMAAYRVTSGQATITGAPGVGGTLTVQVRRVRAGVPVDVFTVPITVASGQWSAADGVVGVDDIQAGDVFFPDRDTIHTTTPALGLSVAMTIEPL